jgi:hypothetical protein
MPDLQPIVQKISTKYDSAGIAGFLKDLGKIPPSAGLAVAAIGITAGFMLDCAKAADQSQQITRQLNQTLETTGRIAQISAPQLGRFAEALAGVSTIDDEQINQAYMAIAQFERVPSDKIDEVAIAAANMSAALGGDIVTNAKTLAGILDTGLIPRSLKFTDTLKEQIKAFIKAGDTGSALNLILGEMDKKYGGQAALALESVSGMVQKLTNDFGELQEKVGNSETGIFHDALVILDAYVKAMGDGTNNTVDFIEAYQNEVSALRDVNTATKDATMVTTAMMEAYEKQMPVIDNTVAGLDKLSEALGFANTSWQEMAVNAYQAQLALDGSITDEDIEKILKYRMELGLLSEAEYEAALQAITLKKYLDLLPRNIDISVIMTEKFMKASAPVNPSGDPNWTPYSQKASGGQLGKGWNMVGEEGYELISPSGMVIPHKKSKELMAKGLRDVTGLATGSYIPSWPPAQKTTVSYGDVSGLAMNGGLPMPGKPKTGGGYGGTSGTDEKYSTPSTAADTAAAAASSAQQAGAAAGQAAQAASSISKSISQMTQFQNQAQSTNMDQLGELRGIRADLARQTETIISEFRKAMQ